MDNAGKTSMDENSNGQVPMEFDVMPLAVRDGLKELLQCHAYANDLSADVWEFATDFERLCSHGIGQNDLRWMLRRGWLEHAYETTNSNANNGRRSFDSNGAIAFAFTSRSCFVLTSKGLEIAEETIKKFPSCEHTVNGSTYAEENASHETPRWDAARNKLYFGNALVKEFKLPSPNQTAIIAAFDEEQWPARIDDPLPCNSEVDPKERLRFTVKSLNRNQKNRAIRFKGDGTGQGILWEPYSDVNGTTH